VKLLLINQPWFAKEFRELGHEVVCVGTAPYCELQLPSFMHLDTILTGLPKPFSPDRILFYDTSAPLLFPGFQDTQIPTLFYSVDTHHHVSLHTHLAHCTNLVLVAQKDYLTQIKSCNHNSYWLPLWASNHCEPSQYKDYGAVFIGTLNAKLNPDRVSFFQELCKKTPVFCTTGGFTLYFPKAYLVVNQTVKGDLNFRVFESMACGPLLLTERTSNGLLELFEDEVHLVTYEKGNVDEAAEKIHRYLSNHSLLRSVAEAGRSEVLEKHLPIHRAQAIINLLADPPPRVCPTPKLSAMVNFVYLSQQLLPDDPQTAATALVLALKEISFAVAHCEPMTDELACYAISACLEFDRLARETKGKRLLNIMIDTYPDQNILQLMRVREFLYNGQETEARSWIECHYDEPAEVILLRIESLLQILTPYAK
jgi:Glycosyl transferases group 1